MLFFFNQKVLIFFIFPKQTCVVGTHQKCLDELLLISTHNICFHREIRNIWIHTLIWSYNDISSSLYFSYSDLISFGFSYSDLISFDFFLQWSHLVWYLSYSDLILFDFFLFLKWTEVYILAIHEHPNISTASIKIWAKMFKALLAEWAC